MAPATVKQQSRITQLSQDAISRLTSSKHITTLQGAAIGLLENSLDAGASRVDITIDFRRGGCTVDDNGSGIARCEFEDDGGLGRMYWTSKRNHGQDLQSALLGSSGTFLAQLSTLSLLSISSTQDDRQGSASVTLHHGNIIARKLLTENEGGQRLRGTQVEVRDLFGNIPVRVKQRVIFTENKVESDKAWHDFKHGVVSTLLAWPHPCSARLRHADDPTKTLNIAGQHPERSAALTSNALARLSGRALKFDLRDALPILFQSGLIPADTMHSWVPLAATSSTVRLNGLVCTQPCPTKDCQFIALGVHPLRDDKQCNELYECANKLFENSDFGVVNDDGDQNGAWPDTASQSPDCRRVRTPLEKGQSRTRKGVDRHAMFCLQFDIRPGAAQVPADYARLDQSCMRMLTELLQATLMAWLETHHFRPKSRKRRAAGDRTAASPHSTPSKSGRTVRNVGLTVADGGISLELASGSTVLAENLFKLRASDLQNWSGAKFSRSALAQSNTPAVLTTKRPEDGFECRQQNAAPRMDHTREHTSTRAESRHALSAAASRPQIDGGGESSDEFGSVDEQGMLTLVEGALQETMIEVRSDVPAEDPIIDWTDKITNQVYRINSRTGVVVQEVNTRSTIARVGSARRPGSKLSDVRVQSAQANDGRTRREGAASDDAGSRSEWLPGFLAEWKNPVFATPSEAPIPIARPIELAVTDGSYVGQDSCQHRDNTTAAPALTRRQKISKVALRQATIIGQVDRKFILCRVPAIHASETAESAIHDEMLVLVDQHAASERVILEDLFAKLCERHGEVADTMTEATHAIDGARRSPQRASLAKPLIFEIPGSERELFAQYRDHFAQWDVVFSLTRDSSSETSHRIRVEALPATIAERCINTPALCIELMRTEIWALHQGKRRPALQVLPADISANGDRNDGPFWLRRISSCPQGIIDMLNSRACRSAIMFNDELSHLECQTLVAALGRCVFPFVCAHGRVAMVPLSGLDAFEGLGFGILCSGQ